jgi:hypothetical protein
MPQFYHDEMLAARRCADVSDLYLRHPGLNIIRHNGPEPQNNSFNQIYQCIYTPQPIQSALHDNPHIAQTHLCDTMPTTISPFRYLEVARILVNRLLDQAPKATILTPASAIWKGKAREIDIRPVTTPSTYSTLASAASSSSSGSATSSRQSNLPPVTSSGSRSPTPLGPDPSYPPEPGDIYRLMNDERLLIPGAIKPPKEIVVLCHGENSITDLLGVSR